MHPLELPFSDSLHGLLPRFHLKGEFPVAREVKVPDALAVPGELMGLPKRERAEFLGILHIL